jgi:hypothetical protein
MHANKLLEISEARNLAAFLAKWATSTYPVDIDHAADTMALLNLSVDICLNNSMHPYSYHPFVRSIYLTKDFTRFVFAV